MCGQYKIVLENEFGAAISSAYLFLKQIQISGEAPMIVKHLTERVEVQEGDSFVLDCTFSGLPIPSVSWYKDNIEIQASGGRTSIDITNDLTTLAKISAKLSDSGIYSALIKNQYGHKIESTRILVLPAEISTEAKESTPMSVEVLSRKLSAPIIDELGCHSLRLAWSHLIEPNLIDHEFKIQYRMPDVQFWSDLGVTEASFMDVRNLQQNTEYMF
uniref:Ig-like domain-containing protein n=1 Tax=Romanomermis culicivorax TaxID=13658 RepID=A0A915JT78_ROMCU